MEKLKPSSSTGARFGCDGGVKEARKDSGVGADIFENGDDVESGLIIRLRGFDDRRINAEGVRCTAAALDPYASHSSKPFAALHCNVFCGSLVQLS